MGQSTNDFFAAHPVHDNCRQDCSNLNAQKGWNTRKGTVRTCLGKMRCKKKKNKSSYSVIFWFRSLSLWSWWCFISWISLVATATAVERYHFVTTDPCFTNRACRSVWSRLQPLQENVNANQDNKKMFYVWRYILIMLALVAGYEL